MFNLSVNLLTPASGRKTFTYGEMFDPRVNKTYFKPKVHASQSYLTLSQYKSVFKDLYTVENIKKNPGLLINGVHNLGSPRYLPYQAKFIAEICATIPEDKLWLLSSLLVKDMHSDYCTFGYYYIRDGFEHNDSQYSTNWDSTSIRMNEVYWSGIDAARTEEFKRQLLLTLDKIEKNWNKFLTLTADKEITSFAHASPFVKQYVDFLTDVPYIADTIEGGTLTYKKFLARYGNKPTVTIGGTGGNSRNSLSFAMRRSVTKEDRSAIEVLLNYKANPLDFLSNAMKRDHENDPPLYGIELEISTDYDVPTIVRAADEPFFICKQDSTITGSKPNMMEIVTAPISFKKYREQLALWFANLDMRKIDTTTLTNNGMHIHIGKSHFQDEKHLSNFTWFLTNPHHFNFMLFISERDKKSMDKFAQFPRYADRSMAAAYIRSVEHCSQMERHCAVNFQKGVTVEVRIFKGVASYTSILKNLEFIDAVFNFAMESTPKALSLRNFLDWLGATSRNRYIILKKFFDAYNMNETIQCSEVLDTIWGVNDATTIIQKLNGSGMSLNKLIADEINHTRGTKIIFNPTDKKFELDVSTFGRLSKFDEALLREQAQHYKIEKGLV